MPPVAQHNLTNVYSTTTVLDSEFTTTPQPPSASHVVIVENSTTFLLLGLVHFQQYSIQVCQTCHLSVIRNLLFARTVHCNSYVRFSACLMLQADVHLLH
jgi:hypothetical protein